MKKYELAVFIGRIQPLTLAHENVIRIALTSADRVAVLIGSVNEPRNHRNPWSFEERKKLVELAFPDDIDRIHVLPVEDTRYNIESWIKNVQEAVGLVSEKSTKIALIGHNKDGSSFYLKLFPQWDNIDIPNYQDINATQVRETFFFKNTLDETALSPTTVEFLSKFALSEDYRNMVAEYEFVKNYKDNIAYIDTSLVPANLQSELDKLLPFLKAKPKWPPKYVTVDAVVVQSGHVLLVQRGGFPGKGLWALPGGFLEDDERIRDGVVRELKEETRIKVPVPVLRGSIVAERVFDDPYRSSRGRTIDHAFLFQLNESSLPKIKGSDDAVNAKWMPISEITRGMMFEDHKDIIDSMLGLLK